jgi:hypothetical protein
MSAPPRRYRETNPPKYSQFPVRNQAGTKVIPTPMRRLTARRKGMFTESEARAWDVVVVLIGGSIDGSFKSVGFVRA